MPSFIIEIGVFVVGVAAYLMVGFGSIIGMVGIFGVFSSKKKLQTLLAAGCGIVGLGVGLFLLEWAKASSTLL